MIIARRRVVDYNGPTTEPANCALRTMAKKTLKPKSETPTKNQRYSLTSALTRAEAKMSGLLPHEWLLKVVRGEPIAQSYAIDVLDKQGNVIGQEILTKDVYPDLQMRQDAAKAAAPYYAPRLATQVITLRGREDLLNQLSDDQLDAAIKELTDPKTAAKRRRQEKELTAAHGGENGDD